MVATGSSLPPALPDVGRLTYNTVDFDCLYTSTLSGRPVPDAAGRTYIGIEWTIAVEGVITLLPSDNEVGDLDNRVDNIKRLLAQPGGYLIFQGKGLGDLIVNKPGPFNVRDLAWGPKPTLLDFKPLGGGLAALIKWQCTTLVPVHLANRKGDFLQFNESISIGYDDENYSMLSIRGIMEIPLTRITVNDPTLNETIDNYREKFMRRVSFSIDQETFRVTRRSFEVSRDRRTMEWVFEAVELPPMGLPPDVTSARGTYSVRPVKQGVAMFKWLCSLRATYTVRKDRDRRIAWWAFLSLWQFRMGFAKLGTWTRLVKKEVQEQGNDQAGANKAAGGLGALAAGGLAATGYGLPIVAAGAAATAVTALVWNNIFKQQGVKEVTFDKVTEFSYGLPISFGFDEGLYLDSRTISFEASWTLMANFSSLLIASGVWQWDKGSTGGGHWSASMEDIRGWKSWLENRVDPKGDVIVDINLGGPPNDVGTRILE